MQIQTAKLASLGMDIRDRDAVIGGIFFTTKNYKGLESFKEWITLWVVSYSSEGVF